MEDRVLGSTTFLARDRVLTPCKQCFTLNEYDDSKCKLNAHLECTASEVGYVSLAAQ